MFYKEWKTVQVKFWVWLAIYAIFAFLLTFVWSHYAFLNGWRNPLELARYAILMGSKSTPVFTPTFYEWLQMSAIITVVAAVVGGIDLVAEEKDKGTLSFVLTRPVSRFHIYNSKILLNISALLIAYTIVTIPVFLVDCTSPHPIDLEFLLFTLLIMLVGMAVVCLSGLISIFANNVIQSITLSSVILSFTFTICTFVQINFWHIEWWRFGQEVVLAVVSGIVGTLALIFYQAGLYCFERKEF